LAKEPAPVGIACCQLAPRFGDLDGNRAAAAAAIGRAAAEGARLVVLPELCITGYAFADADEARTLSEPADGRTVEAWSELAARHDLVVVGGFCERAADGTLRNSAAVVDPDGIRAVYRKTHLWAREKLIFTAGDDPPPVVDTVAGRIGVAVCYDVVFGELVRGLALAGADVVAVPMNSPVLAPARGPLAMEVVVAMAAAHVNRVFVAQSDRVGDERGVAWVGASVLVDASGELLAGPLEGEGTLVAEVDLARARDKSWGEHNDVLGDRRPEIYDAAASTMKETAT
jgi:predicted amidohydrolase